jgi:hypothetical protein
VDLLSDAEFWRWAGNVGIGRHPHLGSSGILAFLELEGPSTRWFIPPPIGDAPTFMTQLLIATGAEAFVLWRRGGGAWIEGLEDFSRNQAIDVVLRGAGIPDDHDGALRLERGDWARLWAITLAICTFGWSVGEDLFILPSDGSFIAMISHHDELLVTARSPENEARFVAEMHAAGYQERQ